MPDKLPQDIKEGDRTGDFVAIGDAIVVDGTAYVTWASDNLHNFGNEWTHQREYPIDGTVLVCTW